MGKELNDRISAGSAIEQNNTSEHALLQRELEETTLIKDYIQSQKDYLDLLGKVIEKIKNPT